MFLSSMLAMETCLATVSLPTYGRDLWTLCTRCSQEDIAVTQWTFWVPQVSRFLEHSQILAVWYLSCRVQEYFNNISWYVNPLPVARAGPGWQWLLSWSAVVRTSWECLQWSVLASRQSTRALQIVHPVQVLGLMGTRASVIRMAFWSGNSTWINLLYIYIYSCFIGIWWKSHN